MKAVLVCSNTALVPRVRRWSPRSRTGCLTCRTRRIKCDEAHPICQLCLASRRTCCWPATPRPAPPVLPAGGSAQVLDLLRLIPRTAPGLVMREYIGDGLNITLSISHRVASYLFELPVRVGHCAALDGAVACVAAALRWRHGKTSAEDALSTPHVLALYGRALQALRRALDDGDRVASPEVLCATELLCIFEALARNEMTAYYQHAAGAAKLIQHRGATRFTTEFEKSLLAARFPSLIVESFFRGEHLFLAQDKWQRALQRCISCSPTAPDRSEIAISLYQIIALIPGLLADAKSLLQRRAAAPAPRAALLRRARGLRTRLLQWHACWGARLFDPPPAARILPGEEGRDGKMLDLLCIYETFLMDCNRLCVALAASEDGVLEQDSLRLAAAMTAGWRVGAGAGEKGAVRALAHGVYGNSIQAPIIAQCLGVAAIVLDTADEWAAAIRQRAEGEARDGMLDPRIFLHWLGRLGFGVKQKQPIPL